MKNLITFALFATLSLAMLVTTSIILENPNTPMALIVAIATLVIATAALAVAHLND